MFRELPARPELRRYGYAPGGYMGKCRECHNTVTDIDKRARCCLPCAEKLFAEETTEKSYFPLCIEYTDTGTTATVYSPDAIPTGRAFKILETQYNG